MNEFLAKAPIRVQQDVDLVLKNMKPKILRQPHVEVLMMTDSRYMHYKANEDCIDPKDCLLFRKNFGVMDSVKYYQIIIPKQLVNEVLCSLHFGRQPGIVKTKIAHREELRKTKIARKNQGVDHVM